MADLNFTRLSVAPFHAEVEFTTYTTKLLFYLLEFEGKIFSYGGHVAPNAGTPCYDLHYSSDGISWTRFQHTAPLRTFDSQPFVLNGFVYGPVSTALQKSSNGINFTTTTASSGALARTGGSSCVLGGYAFFGGGSSAAFGMDIWRSPDALTWTRMADVPGSNYVRNIFAFSDRLIAWTGPEIYQSLNLGGSWTLVPSTGYPSGLLSSTHAFTYGNKIFICPHYHYDFPDSPSSQLIYRWDIATGAWTGLSFSVSPSDANEHAGFGYAFKGKFLFAETGHSPWVYYPSGDSYQNVFWISDFPPGTDPGEPGSTSATAPIDPIALRLVQKRQDAGTLEPPDLLAPDDGSINRIASPVLKWTNVLIATSYEVAIAYDLDFEIPFQQFTASTTELQVGLPFGATLYWKVRAMDGSGGRGLYSETWVIETPSLIPAPVSDHSTDGRSRILNQFGAE